MKRILGYISSYKFRIFWQFVIKIIGTCMDLFLPYILNHIIINVIPTKNVGMIFFYGGIMIICAIIGMSFNIIANRSASFIAKIASTRLRHDLFDKIESLSFDTLNKVGFPSLTTRITSDTYNVHQAVGSIQRMGVRAPILLVGGLVITFILDARLALLLLAIIPFILVSSYFITKKGIPLYKDIQKTNDEMVTILRENYNGVRVIKALNKEDKEIIRYEQKTKEIKEKELKAGRYMSTINPLMNLLLNLGLVGVCFFGAFLVNDGIIKSPVIVAFLSYFTIILNATLMLTRIFVTLSRANASLKRIDEVFALEDEDSNNSVIKTKETYLKFEHVSFAYGEGKESLIDIDFELKAGESLGIIGPTGSGKTTIISLLMKFYNPSKGIIYFKGKNLSSYTKDEFLSHFGIAMQNDILFSESIKENILFGRQYDEEKLYKAISVSQSKEFIELLPLKEETILAQKGSNLSGGQKQRILLARALYNEPEILILDDSTSALDFKTDALFRKSLKEQYPNTSLIIISSRVATLKNMNNILVLEDGRIVEQGKHDDLISAKKLYHEIFVLQEGDNYA